MLNLEELLCGDTRQMSSVIRYSSLPHGRGENVAEHSFYVAFYALIIAKDLEQDGQKIDYEKLLVSALLHDLDEAITGDIIRTVKYSSKELRDRLGMVAEFYCKRTLAKFKVAKIEELFSCWDHARDPESLEGCILQLCDMLSVIAYCVERIKSGNVFMQTILRGAHDNFITKFKHPVYERYKAAIAEIVGRYAGHAPKQEMILIDEFNDGNPAEETQGGKKKKDRTTS